MRKYNITICKSKVTQIKKLFQDSIYTKVSFSEYADRLNVIYSIKENSRVVLRDITFYF
jgi:hypothetical protein